MLAASQEIRGSIVYATLIILLAFLPLFFLSGVEGLLLRPLGLAYGVSLAASMAVALMVTPVLCSLLLPRSGLVLAGEETALLRWLKRRYEPGLGFALRRWRVLLGGAAMALLAASLTLFFAGQSFLPDFNEGTLTLNAVTLPGTDLKESDRLGRLTEQVLLRHPEVVATARRTGRAELDEHAQDVNAAEIDVSLRLGRPKEELLAALRKDLTLVPGMNFTIGQPISHRIDHMLSGTRANIAVKIFGDELHELRRLALLVQEQLRAVRGVVDLSLEQQSEIPLLTLRFDRVALGRFGLRVQQVAEAVETAFRGQEVSRVLEGQAAFDLVVRFSAESLADLDAVRGTLIDTPTGARVPLHALAEIRKDRGPNTISREGVQRKLVVQCNVSGRDLRSVVQDLRARVQAAVPLPPGYRIAYGGQFESAEEASRALLGLGAAAVLGMFLLLFLALGALRDALLVMTNLPLALIGGLVGVHLSGGVLSVASLIGFIPCWASRPATA